jgi:hypothetical protein
MLLKRKQHILLMTSFTRMYVPFAAACPPAVTSVSAASTTAVDRPSKRRRAVDDGTEHSAVRVLAASVTEIKYTGPGAPAVKLDTLMAMTEERGIARVQDTPRRRGKMTEGELIDSAERLSLPERTTPTPTSTAANVDPGLHYND